MMLNAYYAGRITRKFNGCRKKKKKKEAYFTKYTINSKVSRDSFKEVQKNLQKKIKSSGKS